MKTTETYAAASEPEYFMRDGKLARRTFIKGVGAITVASALGFGMSGAGVPTAGADGAHSSHHRPAAGCLFFRHENLLDPG